MPGHEDEPPGKLVPGALDREMKLISRQIWHVQVANDDVEVPRHDLAKPISPIGDTLVDFEKLRHFFYFYTLRRNATSCKAYDGCLEHMGFVWEEDVGQVMDWLCSHIEMCCIYALRRKCSFSNATAFDSCMEHMGFVWEEDVGQVMDWLCLHIEMCCIYALRRKCSFM